MFQQFTRDRHRTGKPEREQAFMQQYLSFPCPLADTAHRIDANAGGGCSQEI
jgi:hypothetical protein